jgi:hypothetical protein
MTDMSVGYDHNDQVETSALGDSADVSTLNEGVEPVAVVDAGETPSAFVCECGRTFKNLGGLSVHKARAHGDPAKRAAWANSIRESQLRKNGKLPAANPRSAAGRVEAIYEQMTSAERGAFRKRRANAAVRGKSSLNRFYLAEIDRWAASHPSTTSTTVSVMPADPQPVDAGPTIDELDYANMLFSKVALATDVLFPQGVPSGRIIEVAEWQTTTLRMLQR